ncbi:MAG: PAS domain S-box protein, partial [Halobacteriaceae archaeon]
IQQAVERRRAEQARQRQIEAIQSAHEGISILNDDGEFIYVNDAYADLYGYEPEEMIGEHWELIYPEEEISFARDKILPTVIEEGAWHGETTGLRADGSTFPEDHVVSQTDHGDLVCTVRDLSDRRDRKSELRMKTRAMDEAPVGITISDPDQDDNPLIYVNDRFEELTGYDEEEIIGRNCRFLQGETTESKPVATMRERIDAAEPVTVELRNYRKDGSMFWNRVKIAPVEDDEGTVTNFVGFQEDITDRKQRERELERFETTIETFPDGVAIYDQNLNCIYVNDALVEESGMAREEFLDSSIETLFDNAPEDQAHQWISKMQRLIAGDQEQVRQTMAFDTDEGKTYANLRGGRIESDAGDLLGVVEVSRDITERREQERQLETLIDNLPGMVYRCKNERGWPMEDVRGEVEKLTGYAPS